MDAIVKTKGLDAIELAALRKADCVSFHHHRLKTVAETGGAASFIRATKEFRQSKSNPFGKTEAALEISVGARLTEYTRGDDAIPYEARNEAGDYAAFEMIHAAQFDDVWKSIVALLRVGDELTLHWRRGAFTTDAMQEASPKFYGDQLLLQVDRGDKRLTFMVDMSVTENNTARMIRRA
jgi:hypothetical protein